MTAEATRALTHLTARAQIPAPLLYDVHEGDGSAPQHNASTARVYLADAARHARALGGLLDAAQTPSRGSTRTAT